MKPRLFIGSSSENLGVAYAAQENLEHVAEVTVWTQGVFNPSKFNLESLAEAIFEADFGVFVFAPDDVTSMRGTDQPTVRDNVIFELGMFVGRLGRERCFMLVPRAEQKDLHLPTDLLGLSPGVYDSKRSDGNFRAALGPACNAISQAVKRLGPSELAARPTTSRIVEAQEVVAKDVGITDEERAILKAMITGNYNGRSLTGLARDSGLTKTEVNGCVTSLMKKGLIDQGKSKSTNEPRWSPTAVGRLIAGA